MEELLQFLGGYIQFLDNLLNGQEKIINSSTNSSNIQSYIIKSTDFIGDEAGGENSILFEGFNASSKIQRLRMQLIK